MLLIHVLFLDYPVICTSNNELTAFIKENNCWESRIRVPRWCDDHTRGCHIECVVAVAGSKKDAHCQKVELLNMLTEEINRLPDLFYLSACVGMAWDHINYSLILAGGDQHRDGEWNVTDEMFILTHVGLEGSKWKPLSCKLPYPMKDPGLLMSDTHLYLLGCDGTRRGARRIPRDKIKPYSIPDSKPESKPDPKPESKPDPKPDPKPESKPDSKPDNNIAYTIPLQQHFDPSDWEKLEDLESEFNGTFGHGGAVFIQGKVIVFTLHHIMTLNTETEPPSWNTVRIEKDLKICIPRLVNSNNILVLMNGQNIERAFENFMEIYDPKKNTWKPWKPSVQNVIVRGASLVPWKFFVVQDIDATGNLLLQTKYLQYRNHLF